MEHYTNSCDACHAHIEHDQLTLDISGGYDHFTDSWSERKTLTLCHDCVLRMIELFPVMGEKLGKGCHPCNSMTPCCAFAWRSIDDVCVVPADDLRSWVPLYQNGVHI